MSNDKILEFSGASVEPAPHHVTRISDATLSIGGGDLLLLLIEEESDLFPFCDLAQGLMDPDKGSVSFMGQSWLGMPASQKEAMRSMIGRVFERNGWVSNLTVRENIELSERHHTLRSAADIRGEAEQLCQFLGLPDALDQRPDFVMHSVLRRAEWVRAFMGRHCLALLEYPEKDVPSEFLPMLIELISGALKRQSGVVWITADRDIWSNKNFIEGIRFRVTKGQILQVQEV